MGFHYFKLLAILTLGLSLSAPVLAQDVLTQALNNPGDTLSQVKLDLWTQGIEREQTSEMVQKQAQIPEELTLGLEKWESSL